VKDAVELHRRGLDFADALHWVCSAACGQFVTFDDRGFVRRAQALKLVPEVAIPGRAWWARATQSMEHGTDSVEMVTVSVILVSSVHKRMQGVNGIGDLGRRHLNGAQQASQKRPPASFECAGPGVPE
ncbi:MAG: hypothetical protein ACREXU_01905, partial [Gammaproteobacteria bacterium]